MDDNFIVGNQPASPIEPDEPRVGIWPPFSVYDMVQMGYPRPNHGGMVERFYGGSDENGNILPPKGMWCKTEDAMREIAKSKDLTSTIEKWKRKEAETMEEAQKGDCGVVGREHALRSCAYVMRRLLEDLAEISKNP